MFYIRDIIPWVIIMDGWILVNKPVGMSSYDVVSQMKKIFDTRKVGHCGTLDPFAAGLLAITLNNATKISQYLEGEVKTYEATLELGKKTDTGDKTGKVVAEKEVPELSKELIESAFSTFLGEQKQVPPMYSAIKVSGQPLYKMARSGQEVARKPRVIKIIELSLLDFNKTTITFRVQCSKGTYIRTLGEDIAIKLGTVGNLVALTRTGIGHFTLAESHELNSITNQTPLLSIRDALADLPKLEVNLIVAKKAGFGQQLRLDTDENMVVVAFQNEFIAIYEKEGDYYLCRRGLK